MKHLVGSLSVSYVNYKSLKFLAGLETIETDNLGVNIALNPMMTEVGLTNLTTVTAPRLLIGSNPNMKTLNIPNLKNIAPSTVVNMVMNVGILKSPNLCITTEEMERFLEKTGPGNTTIVVKYCDPIPGGNVCTSPQYGCTRIFGEILIGRESEWKLEMFKTVEYIFGNLQIYEANLTSFDFLPNLKYIANQDTLNPVLLVEGNSELVTVTFPKIQTFAPYLAVGREMTININPQSPTFCVTTDEMEQILNKSAPGNITVQGKYCDPIPGQNICTSPQNGCTKVLGNVLIGVEPEWKLEMLKSVEYIFGGLHIYEANLKSFDFLPNLKYIANLESLFPIGLGQFKW
ncbi:hypothetical protein CAEBREN_30928 [Caenorhabditis brenneri]|uniref:Receptor L-domain domain-containing protein n=1 Tax=Caenorhabditis brenneri TaxID=135651 RepID=G0PHY9_CAEBE|nr:hypothetical protein CAEBREN_30928 [Caenorhabditis brenneri]